MVYESAHDADIYSRAQIANNWMYDSLEFSLLQRIPLATNDENNSMIDLACGSGSLCRRIANDYAYERIVGIDSSFEMIAQAKQLSSSDLQKKFIEYKVSDCSSMDDSFMLDNQSQFSVVTCQWLYLYACSMEELSQMIANSAALLKSGGMHIGCTLNPLLTADTMTNDNPSEQWKDFGLETVANGSDFLFIDGSNPLTYVSTIKLNNKQQNTDRKKIGANCIEFQNFFCTLDTYNLLFEKHGFCNVHWLSSEEHSAHPSLSKFDQKKYQRYVSKNPSHAIFIMRKK